MRLVQTDVQIPVGWIENFSLVQTIAGKKTNHRR